MKLKKSQKKWARKNKWNSHLSFHQLQNRSAQDALEELASDDIDYLSEEESESSAQANELINPKTATLDSRQGLLLKELFQQYPSHMKFYSNENYKIKVNGEHIVIKLTNDLYKIRDMHYGVIERTFPEDILEAKQAPNNNVEIKSSYEKHHQNIYVIYQDQNNDYDWVVIYFVDKQLTDPIDTALTFPAGWGYDFRAIKKIIMDEPNYYNIEISRGGDKYYQYLGYIDIKTGIYCQERGYFMLNNTTKQPNPDVEKAIPASRPNNQSEIVEPKIESERTILKNQIYKILFNDPSHDEYMFGGEYYNCLIYFKQLTEKLLNSNSRVEFIHHLMQSYHDNQISMKTLLKLKRLKRAPDDIFTDIKELTTLVSHYETRDDKGFFRRKYGNSKTIDDLKILQEVAEEDNKQISSSDIEIILGLRDDRWGFFRKGAYKSNSLDVLFKQGNKEHRTLSHTEEAIVNLYQVFQQKPIIS